MASPFDFIAQSIAAHNGSATQTSSAPTSPSSPRTSPLEDYYNEQMQQKQATEKARDIIDGRGRGLVGGLRDAWLDKHPNVPTMSTALSDDEKFQLQSAYADAANKYKNASKKAQSIRPEEGLDYTTTLEKYRSEQQAATEEKAAAESEMDRLRKQLEFYNVELPDVYQNVFERLWGSIKGGSKQAAGSLGGLFGYTGRVATGGQSAVDKALRASGNEDLSALYHVSTEEEDEKAMQMQQAIANKSAELSESGGRDIERSKWGASDAGKFALDAVSQVPALAADMAANAVLPGSGMAMMMGRSFGGGVQQAEAGGGNLAQAGAYGAASAAKEYLTEKMFGGLDLAYGKGFADTAVEKLVGKLAKTDIGRTVLRTIINGGGGEFVEEFVSSAVDPTLRAIYNGKSIGENYSEEQVSDWLYDGLVGAALGIAGSGVSIATGEDAKKNAKLRSGEVDSAFELMTGRKAASEPQSAAETQGDITTPPTPSNDAVTRPEELNSTVNNNAEMQTTDAQKNTAPNGTESTAVNDNPATHTAEENKIIADYKAAADENVISGIERARSLQDINYRNKFTVTLAETVGDRVVNLVKNATGLDVTGFKNQIKGNSIAHIDKRHGVNGTADHSMANIEDFGRINYVVENADRARLLSAGDVDSETWKLSREYRNADNSQAPLIRFEKRVDNTYYVVEAVPDSKANRMAVVSAYMETAKKEASSPKSVDAAEAAPRATPEASLEISETSDISIPTAEQNVNSGQAENSGSSEQRAKTNLGSKSTRAKTSQAVETLMEADITPEARQEQLNPYIKNGRFDYIPDTNKAQVRRATKKIADVGWEQAAKDFHDNVISGKSSKDLVAEGAILLNNAANSDASGRAYLDLANDFIEMAHRAGETLQAIKIVQQLSPSGRLYLITKTVAKINKNLTPAQRKAIAQKELGTEYDAKAMKKAAKEDIRSLDKYGVKINEDFADKYINAKTEAERDNLLSELQKDIAKQMPSTFGEKFNAFRYTAMLGNFKTQERNVIGNISSLVTKMVKDRLAAGVEGIGYVVSGGKMERTRSAWAGGKLYKEAAADFTAHKSEALGEAKYTSVGEKASKEIEDNRTIFKVNGTWGTDDASHPFARSIAAKRARKAANVGMAILEGWRKGTNWAMEAGDAIFARAAYADAMAGWLKAHKINSFAEATEAQLDKARQFAAREAQEATFRDTNMVSEFVTELGSGWRESNNALARGASKVLDATIPFRKTPANVAVRAVEYSPLGIIETAVKAFEAAKGNVNAAEVINSACKNATGAAIFVAGYFMKMGGKLRGKEDDEELDKAQKATGAMDYSYITNSGKSISLSQFAPVSIPLFMGVRLRELTEDGFQLKDIWPILKGTTSPMLDQSMMQGLNESLAGLASYGDDQDAIGQFIENALLSYASQYVPSIVRQFEQAWEKNRQSTYTDKNAPILTTDAQYTIGKISAGVPGWDYNQSDYIDMWGRKTSQGNAVKRYYNAFLNPVYTSESKREPLDDELERLHKAGKDIDGFPSVYPDSGSKYINLDGNGMQMTQEQFDSYRIERGTKSRELAKEFVESDEYKLMSDTQRAEVLRDLYSLAADRALKSVKTSNGIAYTGKLDDVAKLTDVPEFYASKEILSGAKDNTKENFDAIDQVLKNFGHLKDDTQTALKASELNVNPLLYAQTMGIKSKSWYDTKAAVDKAKGTLGGTDNAIAIAVYNSMKGKSDAEILDAIRAQVTPKAGGQQKAVVRRAEAYMTIAKGNADLGSWLNLVAELNDADENSSVSKDDVYAAWANMGLSARETYAGITRNDFYNIVKSSKSYATKEKYATQIDEDYAKINPAVEKEKAQLGGTVEGHSKEKSKSGTTYTMDDYYRALGLIK